MCCYEVFALGLNPRSAGGLISKFLGIFHQEEKKKEKKNNFTALSNCKALNTG